MWYGMKKLKNLFGGKHKAFKGEGHRLGSEDVCNSSSSAATRSAILGPQKAAPVPNGSATTGSDRAASVGSGSSHPSSTTVQRDGEVPLQGTEEVTDTNFDVHEHLPAHVSSVEHEVRGASPKELEDFQVWESLLQAFRESFPGDCSATYAEVCTLLKRIVENVVKNPHESKYRTLKCSNKQVQEKILKYDGACSVLQILGAKMHNVSEGTIVADWAKWSEEDYFVLDESIDLERCQRLLVALRICILGDIRHTYGVRVFSMALSGERASSDLQRIEFPEEFFTLTAREARSEIAVAARKREIAGMLIPKSVREELERKCAANSSKVPAYKYCVVRVRFHDGIIVQATLRPNDTLHTLYSILYAVVRDPLVQIEAFSHPDRKVLIDSSEVSMAASGFVPKAIINCRYGSEKHSRLPTLNELWISKLEALDSGVTVPVDM